MPRTQLQYAPSPPLGTIAMAVSDDGDPAVIVLCGEHDVSNAAELSRTLAAAIARGHSSVIVDMSSVVFMSAATVGALVAARHLLASQSRALVVRAPPRQVARVLGICGLTSLIDPASVSVASPPSALASWVAVPPTVRHSTGVP